MAFALLLLLFSLAAQAQTGTSNGPPPDVLPPAFQHQIGDAAAGQTVYRYETFGNQGFWTDAMQLPQGIAAGKLTPLQALQIGLSVNIDAVNSATRQALVAALQAVQGGTDPSKTALGDPAVTLALINQNAVIGVVAFDAQGNRKALGNSGSLNLGAGEKVGLTCALCHSITDNSVVPATRLTGSVGKEVDGPTNHALDVGAILATAQRPLAYYPMLQLQFKALNNATIGRGNFPGLLTTPASLPTEAQAITYLTGKNSDGQRYYPVGQFDPLPDGIGNPTHILPFFRTDLSAPWGNDGAFNKLDDFNNEVYTVSLDPTSILTAGGRQYLHTLAGAVGDEIVNDYEQVLKGIGVIPAGKNTSDVIPFVKAQDGLPAGTQSSIIGRRVDNKELLDLNAYLNTLQAPAAGPFDATLASRGRDLFRTAASAGGAGCSACHQLDPNKFVPPSIIPMQALYPGYNPAVIMTRAAPFSPIQDSGGPSPYFDDRVVLADASGNGGVRGYALPLKLDLARRTAMLHDDEITGSSFDEVADILMNAAMRDPKAAHPFFVADAGDRKALIEFMKSLSAAPASFSVSSIASYASYLNGAVAPGELIAISTLGLAPVGSDVKVTFDGVAATLVSATTSQITVIVPYEVSGTATTQLQVATSGQTAVMVALKVAATAPGVFTVSGTGSGQAAVLNEDGTVNSSVNPASRGSMISIFATGAGQLNPPGVDGMVVKSPAGVPVAPVTATIDSKDALVTYAGGSVGLYSGVLQVNAMVPTTARTTNVPVLLNIGGVSSQAGTSIWVK